MTFGRSRTPVHQRGSWPHPSWPDSSGLGNDANQGNKDRGGRKANADLASRRRNTNGGRRCPEPTSQHDPGFEGYRGIRRTNLVSRDLAAEALAPWCSLGTRGIPAEAIALRGIAASPHTRGVELEALARGGPAEALALRGIAARPDTRGVELEALARGTLGIAEEALAPWWSFGTRGIAAEALAQWEQTQGIAARASPPRS